jgi:hypothetical protein
MPLPKPKTKEKQSEFISRCMSDGTMVIEYREKGQRLAVCYVQWKEK